MTGDQTGTEWQVIFQLTSSRRGWQTETGNGLTVLDISTHILTKRMTVDPGTETLTITFQLTSSRRGWHYLRWYQKPFDKISTHILTKRMTSDMRFVLLLSIFQLTSSRRGWPLGKIDVEVAELFQLTSSRRGWQPACLVVFAVKIFQLTSSRRGWLGYLRHGLQRNGISTHILTKRMTFCYRVYFVIKIISTHILTKRMTLDGALIRADSIFQLTSSRRGWQSSTDDFTS